jgi:murein L,D-transpeptidase YafK
MADPEGKLRLVNIHGVGARGPRRRRLSSACTAFIVGLLLSAAGPAFANGDSPKPKPRAVARTEKAAPEARLIEVYKKIGAGDNRAALKLAESLTRDVPTFQLAQLVYGDLLLMQRGRLDAVSLPPADLAASSAAHWNQLRMEAVQRLHALTERPPKGALPRQFIDVPATTQHAIAVDASRSRLYLFENTPKGLRLIADHYVSLGKLGMDKREQGDQRTPLGVYFITSRLDPQQHQLRDFYGAGALTLNYPNEYDRRRGRTGGGIWLHGVPPDNFARVPQATDGCVVLANEDIVPLLNEVLPRRTPVVIANRLDWVTEEQLAQERVTARAVIDQWHQARLRGDTQKLLGFYSAQFASGNLDYTQWSRLLEKEMSQGPMRASVLKELSILSWRDTSELMVVTFGEVQKGRRSGPVKRQYWGKEGGQWKIFYEGVIG